MALMAAGLAFTTGPSTDAIMGALPAGKAGAGSAVNDTTREVGGTLGVAIVGSVLNSAYGAHVLHALTSLGASASTGQLAGQSVVAGMNVAARFPAPLQAAAHNAVSSAFMVGLHRGSFVAACTVAVAALVALVFLPARAAVADGGAGGAAGLERGENTSAARTDVVDRRVQRGVPGDPLSCCHRAGRLHKELGSARRRDVLLGHARTLG
jgi:hypothetical protein